TAFWTAGRSSMVSWVVSDTGLGEARDPAISRRHARQRRHPALNRVDTSTSKAPAPANSASARRSSRDMRPIRQRSQAPSPHHVTWLQGTPASLDIALVQSYYGSDPSAKVRNGFAQ